MSLAPAAAPPASLDLLTQACRALAEASAAARPADRFALAHLAALRTAAAVLASRARPAGRRLRSAWDLLAQVAPELQEWAAFFAAGAAKRAAAQAGLDRAVTAREADDLVRDASAFLALVEGLLGLDPALLDPALLDPALLDPALLDPALPELAALPRRAG